MAAPVTGHIFLMSYTPAGDEEDIRELLGTLNAVSGLFCEMGVCGDSLLRLRCPKPGPLQGH